MLTCASGPRIVFEGSQRFCLHAEEPAAPVTSVYGAPHFMYVLEGSEYFKASDYMLRGSVLSNTMMLSWSSDIQTLWLTLIWSHGQFLSTLGRQFSMYSRSLDTSSAYDPFALCLATSSCTLPRSQVRCYFLQSTFFNSQAPHRRLERP